MTQSGSNNGHELNAQSEEITVYEPAYLPGTDEQVGWVQTSPESEEESFVSDLPPELDDPENPPNPN